MNKIAVTYPHLKDFGGGEIFCEYVANFLSEKYKIDLFFYDTGSVNNKLKFKKNVILKSLKSDVFLLDFFCKRYLFIAQVYLIYYFNHFKTPKYNFIFSAAGEFFCKENQRVYQYIHHPFYSLNPIHYLAIGTKFYELHKIFLRFLFGSFVRTYFFINYGNFKKTFTFVNSNWTLNRFKSIYPYNKTKVLYPTFKMKKYLNKSFKYFQKRKNDLVILGRIGSDKNTFKAIIFFLKLKRNNILFKNTKLHIIGPNNNKNKEIIKYYATKYKKDLKFYGYLKLKERDKVLQKFKFGFHLTYSEHFGRSILEMQKNQMIVFIHNSGGARELCPGKYLLYNNLKELEEKLINIFKNDEMKKKIFCDIKKKFNNNFSSNTFDNCIRRVLL